jgi:tetratricopeptide (TPR) repeat protein
MKRALAIVVLALSIGLPSWALPKEKDSWIRLDADHFTLFSNGGVRITKRISNQVGKLKQALDGSSVGMETHSPLPTYIYVFRSGSTFRDYAIGLNQQPERIAGFFAGGDDGNYVAINAGSGNRPEEVVFHEYVHYWLDNNVPAAPLWVSEGLAEYYSTFSTRDRFAEIGVPALSHAQLLRGKALIPMTSFLTADTSSADYHEQDRVGLFYAQCWVAVHFLMSDEENRGKLGDYFQKLNAGMDALEAFKQTWGLSLEQFQKKLEAYVAKDLYPYYKLTFERKLEDTSATVTPMDRQAVLFRLGDLLAHNPPIQFAAAEEHLLGALAIDEEMGEAWATLGFLDQLRGEDRKAAGRFEKALSFDANDARTHWLYGVSLLGRFEDSLDTGFETFDELPPMLAQARKSLQRALELNPGHPPSVVGLARTYVYEPHSDETLYAIQQGLDAMPSRTDLLLDLVIVSAHRGNLAGAWRILNDSLRPRADSTLVRSAEGLIAQVAIEQAFALVDEDKELEAVQLLSETADATTTGPVKRQLRAQATSLGTHVLEGEDLDFYDAAIIEANEGRLDDAIAMLGELIERTDQEKLKLVADAQREALIEIQRETENITLFNRAVTLANDHKFEQALAAIDELLARNLDTDLRNEARKVRQEIAKVTAP